MAASQTFGQLKHGLMQNGVFIPSEIMGRQEVATGISSEESKQMITLAFCDDFFVKTFISQDPKNAAKVSFHEGSMMVHAERLMVEVDVVPAPKFLQQKRLNRDPVSHNIDLDGNCLNLFFRVMKKLRLNMSLEKSVTVIQSAFEEGVADLVQLNLDYFDADDRGFFKLVPLVQDIRKKFSTFISLRGFPPKNLHVIDSIYASGIDLLNYPLEVFARSESLDNLYSKIEDSLRYAVGVFPQGAVSTELIFNGEDPLKEKIDQLTEWGVIPLVKLPLGVRKGKTDYPQIVDIARHLSKSAERHKLNLKWLYPTSEYITPLDAAFFTSNPKEAQLAVRPLYQTMLGRKANEGFTALRRKLRVRNISDSFESAGL